MRKVLVFASAVSIMFIGLVSCSSEDETPIENTKVSKKAGVEIELSTKNENGKVVYTYAHNAYKNNELVGRRTFTDTLPSLGDTLWVKEKKPKQYNFYVTVK